MLMSVLALQNSERAGGPREGEDGAAGPRPPRKEEILLLTAEQFSHTHTQSSTTLK